eukprot:gnl/MRDRNA2_/MRDRNA2_53179_c0_seq1.p1 gnl/MRDRNA2_/MRDRNA2_53179_c0~~gnl/MRDRNA2_/MRDRNA2_53179_c0_seq1.p1  ORF type:complete len:1113 (-),score=329.99 gnl/MRDRNA2_/MRDRNA2_53179_c0_seq1:538-3876(-)
MDATKMMELMRGLQSPDNNLRQQAEKMYSQAKAQQPDAVIMGMLSLVGTTGTDPAVRTQTAVLLRRLVMQSASADFVFDKLQVPSQAQVCAGLLQAFEAEAESKIQRKIAEAISELASYLSASHGWPELCPMIFRMAQPTQKVQTREAALRLLKDTLSSLHAQVVQAKQEIGQLMQSALSDAAVEIRVAGLLLLSGMVQDLDKNEWQPLQAALPMLLQVLQSLAQSGCFSQLDEVLQSFIETAGEKPLFFKPQITQFIQFLGEMAKARVGCQMGLRKLALEWIVSYCEKKPKLVVKAIPSFPQTAVEICMGMLAEVDDSEDALRSWAERMDDEEGDEDEDEIFHAGAEALERLCDALGIEALGGCLFTAIGMQASQQDWRAKHAAITAIKQVSENLEEEEHVNEFTRLILPTLEHQHPRVRCMALEALGELAENMTGYQEKWHSQVVPALVRKFDDPVERVQAAALSAFTSFGEELEKPLMMTYATGIMEKLMSKLTNSRHRMVREESITSIAVIAGSIEDDFKGYYDHVMPVMKQFVMSATSEKESRLRGKAFECISMFGVAVGKDKFLQDAQSVMGEMLKTQVSSDDIQADYIKQASERICKVLKRDFAPFLPNLLPSILESLKIDQDTLTCLAAVAGGAGEETQDGDDPAYMSAVVGGGKVVKVKNSKFEEMKNAVNLLQTFCVELGGAYLDCTQMTAEALLPLLVIPEDVPVFLDEVREAAFKTWAALIKCAKTGAAERSGHGGYGGQSSNTSDTITPQLLQTLLARVSTAMETDTDPDTIGSAAEGIAECLKSAGPGHLNDAQAQGLVQQSFANIDRSFARSSQSTAPGNAQTGKDEDGDEDDDDVDSEMVCRRHMIEMIEGVMIASPQVFISCLPFCSQKMQAWLSRKEDRVLAMDLASNIVEHLGENGKSVWPIFMPTMINALESDDAEERLEATDIMNKAASIPAFAEVAPTVFQKLANLLSTQKKGAKKKDLMAKMALDNATAALVRLSQYQAAACPAGMDSWGLALAKCPLRQDEEEGKKTHKILVELVLQQHAGILGPNNAHLGKLLSIFAEVHSVAEISDNECDAGIEKIFKMLPQDLIKSNIANFSEKQQKKIETILSK